MSTIRSYRPLICWALLLLPLGMQAQPAAASSEAFAHWVPAPQALSGGQLQEGLFAPAEAAEIQAWLRPQEREGAEHKAAGVTDPSSLGCDVLLVTSAGRERSEPAKALDEAALGLFGSVTAIDAGLFRGRIASIVTVQVDRWLKAPPELSRPSVVHFLYEEGAMTIGDTAYCRRGTRQARLEVGRRVLLAGAAVLQEDPILLLPYDRQLFFETAKHGVSGPAAESAGSWAELEERIVRTKGGRRR